MFNLFGKRRQRQQESQTHLGKGVKNVEKLLKLGVEKKRSGDLVKAERLCRQAIELAPSNVVGYYNLAKTSYLAGNRSQAIVNYLRALHISLLNRSNDPSMPEREAFALDADFKEFLLSRHEAAIYLPFQQNITSHLGHALIDLDNSVLRQTHGVLFQERASDQTFSVLSQHIARYRSCLYGANEPLEESLEENTYGRVGLFYGAYNINWSSLGSATDVRSIYPDDMPLPHPYNQPVARKSSAPDHNPSTETQELIKLAKQGDIDSQIELGMAYIEGRGVGRDAETGIAWWAEAAKQNDSRAWFNLGVAYQQGVGVAQDDSRAESCFRKAAEAGHFLAQNNLGLLLSAGRCTRKAEREEIIWFQRAAEQGLSESQFNLGKIFDEGMNVAVDYETAFKWYSLAAEQDNVGAQNNLGRMYEEGRGVARDIRLAVHWYRLAAEQGVDLAQRNLARVKRTARGE